MILYEGKKITANQAAKLIVADQVDRATSVYWAGNFGPVDDDRLTDREADQIQNAIIKQQQRVWDFLGYWALHDKYEK